MFKNPNAKPYYIAGCYNGAHALDIHIEHNTTGARRALLEAAYILEGVKPGGKDEIDQLLRESVIYCETAQDKLEAIKQGIAELKEKFNGETE